LFSIKSSYADCLTCELLNSNSCILETNSKEDLSKVEVVFVAENPGKEEVKTGRPLIGKAGKEFRKPFNKYIKNDFKWVLTNCVLCQTILEDGKTGNPTKDIIERCKINCFELIRICSPRLIVLMGDSAKQAFEINGQITKIRGNIFKWEDYDVLVTVHPSYVLRNRSQTQIFESDIMKASELLGKRINVTGSNNNNIAKGKKRIFYYEIPEKFYSDDYRLVDVQFINKTNNVLYIFRDKNNNKITHLENDDYVYYQISKDCPDRKIVNYDNLHQVKIKYKDKYNIDLSNTYESDLKITTKHCIDYYIKSKGESQITDLNILFTDIEVYTESMEFPNPIDAAHPIVIITNYFNGKYYVYVLDNKKLLKDNTLPDINTKKENSEILVFSNEKSMLYEFAKDLKKLDPDIITGWNVINFDIRYIVNRMAKLGISPNLLSKFGETFVHKYGDFADILGYSCIDMLFLYRSFTFTKEESYTLDYISKKVLGYGKLDTGSSFSKSYRNDINKAIDYNIHDVKLVVELNNALKHISLQNDLRQTCATSFKSSTGQMSKLDSLLVYELKKRNLSSKSADQETEKDKLPGAFVKDPIIGIHDDIVDFDFTSLYPSLIMTYNLGLNTFVGKLKDTSLGYELFYDRKNFPDKVIFIEDPEYSNTEKEYSKDEIFKMIDDKKVIYTISGCFFKKHEKEKSFYSEILEYWLSSRKIAKKKMFEAKEKHEKERYNAKQLVMKILANSLYGVLGNSRFRFFNLDLARTITLSGQEAIKHSVLESDWYVGNVIKNDTNYKKHRLMTKNEIYTKELFRDTPNIITGDTDSIFVTYENVIRRLKIPKEEKMSYITKWNSQLQNYLNNEVIKNLVEKRNVTPDYNKLDLKNELIIKRGLFVSKKHYAIYVIEQEGRGCDKIKSMGIDTKRSDFPSYSKEALNILLDFILKSDKISLFNIRKFISSTEVDIIEKIKNGEKSIARPISWTKKIEEYKVIPQGVIAMQNWNKLMYNTFSTGSRGYRFLVSGINLDAAPKDVQDKYSKEFIEKGKELQVIALPEDEPRLPHFIIPDIKKMVSFAWKERYQILLDPLLSIEDNILTI